MCLPTFMIARHKVVQYSGIRDIMMICVTMQGCCSVLESSQSESKPRGRPRQLGLCLLWTGVSREKYSNNTIHQGCNLCVWLGGQVVRTLDQQVASSNPGLPTVECNPGQVVNTCASVTKQYNLVPANGWWCLAAGKVTIGLASHWPRVTDISGSPPTGSRPRRGRWASAYTFIVEYGELYLFCSGLCAWIGWLDSTVPKQNHLQARGSGSVNYWSGLWSVVIENLLVKSYMYCLKRLLND